MCKYIDSEKLIAEIERLKKSIDECPFIEAELGASIKRDVKIKTFDELISIITSLQQEQPIDKNILTWRDINEIERIINNVHYEFPHGIGEKSFGEEVLERFREERDVQEQPEVDLEKEIDAVWNLRFNLGWDEHSALSMNHNGFASIARHFYELGKNTK